MSSKFFNNIEDNAEEPKTLNVAVEEPLTPAESEELAGKLKDLADTLEKETPKYSLQDFLGAYRACTTEEQQKEFCLLNVEIITGIAGGLETLFVTIESQQREIDELRQGKVSQALEKNIGQTALDVLNSKASDGGAIAKKANDILGQLLAVQGQLNEFESTLNSKVQQLLLDIDIFHGDAFKAKLELETK